MARRLPLPTLLSLALVAFTMEFDNEAEHRLPHSTTDDAGTRGSPWLVSLAMYLNCLQFVPEQGITMRELERQARTRPNWDGMRRWGYLYLEPAPDDPRPRPPQSAWLVRATPNGRQAQKLMGSLLPEIEERWWERFGGARLEELRRWLVAVARVLPPGLPDCMPILHWGLVNEVPNAQPGVEAEPERDVANLPLPVLLARVLLVFAVEFERVSPVSLAICANVLRVISGEGMPLPRIPVRSGVSKEGVAMALTFLTKQGFAQVLSQVPARRGRLVLLSARGLEVQAQYPQQLRLLEGRWEEKLGARLEGLRAALEPLAGDGTRHGSPLFGGLAPHPEGWRAKVRPPGTLPHFPMVLHRGGYPDGS